MAETSRYGRTRVAKIRAAYADLRSAVQAGDIERSRIRSRTFRGVDEACAEQWGDHALEEIRRAA